MLDWISSIGFASWKASDLKDAATGHQNFWNLSSKAGSGADPCLLQ